MHMETKAMRNTITNAVRIAAVVFDGIMCDGTVYVNDQPCGHRAYGYLGRRSVRKESLARLK